MTYVITEPCVGRRDATCITVCPVDCIHETAEMMVIDPDECIDCGACVPVCPVEAIYAEIDVPEHWAAFAAVNAAWSDGGATAVTEALTDALTRARGLD